MPTDLKQKAERATFEQFCDAAALTIVPGTLQQLPPPAPDVLVELAGVGPVGFELVRLNDPEQMIRHSLLYKVPRLLEAALANLPDTQRVALHHKYRDGHITVAFKSGASVTDCKRALPFVWKELEAAPDGYSGRIDLWGKRAPPKLETIWISRIVTGGRPRFKSFAFGYVLPRRHEEIARKLKKRCACDAPLELLAYVDLGELAHVNAETEIRDVVNRWLPGSQFRRVWVYEGMHQRVAFSVP